MQYGGPWWASGCYQNQDYNDAVYCPMDTALKPV